MKPLLEVKFIKFHTLLGLQEAAIMSVVYISNFSSRISRVLCQWGGVGTIGFIGSSHLWIFWGPSVDWLASRIVNCILNYMVKLPYIDEEKVDKDQ